MIILIRGHVCKMQNQISGTPEMSYNFIKRLISIGIQVLVVANGTSDIRQYPMIAITYNDSHDIQW